MNVDLITGARASGHWVCQVVAGPEGDPLMFIHLLIMNGVM